MTISILNVNKQSNFVTKKSSFWFSWRQNSHFDFLLTWCVLWDFQCCWNAVREAINHYLPVLNFCKEWIWYIRTYTRQVFTFKGKIRKKKSIVWKIGCPECSMDLFSLISFVSLRADLFRPRIHDAEKRGMRSRAKCISTRAVYFFQYMINSTAQYTDYIVYVNTRIPGPAE